MRIKSENIAHRKTTLLAFVQGGYYIISGLWPLIHIQSFLEVTGPKIELWLVKTVGILVLTIGLALLGAAYLRQITLPIGILAIGTCLGLILIDVFYTLSKVILPVYLIDAGVEFLLLVTWIWCSYDTKLWSVT